MAIKEEIYFTDDLTGERIPDGEHETVSFGLDGRSYDIDLSQPNAAALRDALAKYVANARKEPVARKTRAPRKPTAVKELTEGQAARAWLREQGHTVSDRGRLSTELLDLYRQRNVGPPEETQDVTVQTAELDTSNAAIRAWHKVKGYKVSDPNGPGDNPVSGLERNRYLKAHGAA